MKLLVDMNLSPSWVERLARHGFEAVHWSTFGAATAPDVSGFHALMREALNGRFEVVLPEA